MIQIATECAQINNWGKHTYNYTYIREHNIRMKFTVTGDLYTWCTDIVFRRQTKGKSNLKELLFRTP